jgi:hypothetical protein
MTMKQEYAMQCNASNKANNGKYQITNIKRITCTASKQLQHWINDCCYNNNQAINGSLND